MVRYWVLFKITIKITVVTNAYIDYAAAVVWYCSNLFIVYVNRRLNNREQSFSSPSDTEILSDRLVFLHYCYSIMLPCVYCILLTICILQIIEWWIISEGNQFLYWAALFAVNCVTAYWMLIAWIMLIHDCR